jgi:hypothetical protein
MIQQFQGADGAGKMVVQVDREIFFAHVFITFLPACLSTDNLFGCNKRQFVD